MNNENLIKMANHLDSDKVGKFDMRAYCNCALGHSIRVIEGRTGFWNFQWVQGATLRIFGIDPATPTSDFLFGATWPNDPHLAAVRFRYVAQHGAAPSAEQWGRFTYEQKPIEIEEPQYEEVAA